MFSRSSNWKQDNYTYSAKFMYGVNIKAGGIKCIEIRELTFYQN